MSLFRKSKPEDINIEVSEGFQSWLVEQQVSIICSAKEVGCVFSIGSKSDGSLGIAMASFARCNTLSEVCEEGTFWLSTTNQLIRFDHSTEGHLFDGFDKVFIPQMAYTTGNLGISDIMIDDYDTPIFVSTEFGCVAMPSEKYSFKPIWKPPFTSQLFPENRCHLNGLASIDFKPTFVTIAGISDKPKGWLEKMRDGGVVMHIESNEIVCSGLSMPNSPRWYEGELFLHEQGTGHFGVIDIEKGRFDPIFRSIGLLNGLNFTNNYAIISTSMSLGFNDQLNGNRIGEREVSCLNVINLDSGEDEHQINVYGVRTLSSVTIAHKTNFPLLVDFDNNSIDTRISIEPNDDMIVRA